MTNSVSLNSRFGWHYRFNNDLEFKSYVFIDEGLFVGKKDEAERMKTLITEPNYRSEKKVCEPLNIKSRHNFCGASNKAQAVPVTGDDRRYWIKKTVQMTYTDGQWTKLWNLVGSASVREIFYQYLITCVDTSKLRIGKAPMTSTKAEQAAEQCSKPIAAKWLKHAILEQPDCAAHVPMYVGEDYEKRTQWESDLGKMTFKNRPSLPGAMVNLLERGSEEELCERDLGLRGQRSSALPKCILPLDHVTRCVVRHFQGQSSWLKPNADNIKQCLEK